MPFRHARAATLFPALLASAAGSAAALAAGPFGAVVNLSTLNGTTGFVINGIDASDQSAASVASAGDVNGDGYADLIIGALFADPNGQSAAGETYVVFGKATPFAVSLNLSTLNGTTGFVLNGIDPSDQSGFSVASAGDINGDGYDDLIVGAPVADPNGQGSAGETYIVFGKGTPFAASINLSTLDGTTGFVCNGIVANDNSGGAVASAADINGDGYADLIIGAPSADPNGQGSAGETYIVFGKGTPFAASLNLSALNGTTGFVINGIDTIDSSGVSVASAGDVNGDGYADVIIGARNADPNGQSGAGETYVVFGKPTGYAASLNLSSLNGADGFVVNGINVADASGFSVSSAGDINGDGYDDLIIGAQYADPNGQSGAGASYVVFGKPSGFAASLDLSTLNGATGFVVSGIDGDDQSGFSVSSAGDVNGDGYADLVIGARGADSNGQSSAGESYVVFGKPSGFSASLNLSSLNGTTGFVLNGIDASDGSGISVAGAGDVNGDGIDDLIIGARYADPNGQSSAGESYVVFGRPGQVWDRTTGGAWTTASNWLSAAVPSRGIAILEPRFGGTITGPSTLVELRRLTIGAEFGVTTLDLLSTSAITIEEPFTIETSAAIAGSGILAVESDIGNLGLIAPDALTLVSTTQFTNIDLIDIAPASSTAVASLDIHGPCTNTLKGDILLRSGAVEFGVWDGLLNSGHLDIVLADATIFGDITNDDSPAGAINIAAESSAIFTGDITNNSSIVLDADSSLTILGLLAGNGVSGPAGAGTAGPVFLAGGVSPGQSPGIAVFDGDVTLGATATTIIEISGTVPGGILGGHDQVVVAGVLSAAGTLRVSTPGGFIPLPGHAYKVLDFGSIIGTFSTIQLSTALVNANADTSTLYSDGTIRIPTPTCTGDVNGDGFTNAADFVILAGNFGAAVTPNTNGDLNGDGLVNASDFVILAGDFGCTP